MMGPVKVHNRSGAVSGSTDPYCTSMAVVKTGSDLSSVIWTFLLSYSAFITVVKSKPIGKKEWLFLLIGFVLPFIFALMYIKHNADHCLWTYMDTQTISAGLYSKTLRYQYLFRWYSIMCLYGHSLLPILWCSTRLTENFKNLKCSRISSECLNGCYYSQSFYLWWRCSPLYIGSLFFVAKIASLSQS
jgi:hypothetical protein